MSAATYRVIAHKVRGGSVTQQSGQSLALAPGTTYDLDFSAVENRVQGVLVCGLSGTTANRPTNAANGDKYIDTTLSKVVFADGTGLWYDPFTGGAV